MSFRTSSADSAVRKALRKRFSNAARAFTPDEVIYRLVSRDVAGYTVAESA